MANIGNATVVNNYQIISGRAYIHNLAANHYTAGAGEEVYKILLYNGPYDNTGATVTVTVRDISVSVAAGTVLCSEVFTGGNNKSTWQEIELSSPVALTNTNDYAISVWCDNTGSSWNGGIDSTAWNAAKSLQLTGQASVPTDFSAASNSSEGTIAAYAVTQSSASEPVITRHTLFLTDDSLVTGTPVVCSSSNFALGVTATLWPADDENDAEVASSVVAIDSLPTATPQYDVTFTVAPNNAAGDTLHFTYDSTAGDIANATDGTPLASTTFDATVAMTC